jgi:hypothetical protein
MEPEKICPFMSRPADKTCTTGFIPCLREQCMAWMPEYRMTPVGIVQAHCKMLGAEVSSVANPTGPGKNSSYRGFD